MKKIIKKRGSFVFELEMEELIKKSGSLVFELGMAVLIVNKLNLQCILLFYWGSSILCLFHHTDGIDKQWLLFH